MDDSERAKKIVDAVIATAGSAAADAAASLYAAASKAESRKATLTVKLTLHAGGPGAVIEAKWQVAATEKHGDELDPVTLDLRQPELKIDNQNKGE
jgi:hypothetical protein